MEGQNAILFNKSVSLSEQQLIDCAEEAKGCQGGDMLTVLHDMRAKTLYTEKSYPYLGVQGKCHKGENAGIRIKDYFDIIPEEENLKNVVGEYP